MKLSAIYLAIGFITTIGLYVSAHRWADSLKDVGTAFGAVAGALSVCMQVHVVPCIAAAIGAGIYAIGAGLSVVDRFREDNPDARFVLPDPSMPLMSSRDYESVYLGGNIFNSTGLSARDSEKFVVIKTTHKHTGDNYHHKVYPWAHGRVSALPVMSGMNSTGTKRDKHDKPGVFLSAVGAAIPEDWNDKTDDDIAKWASDMSHFLVDQDKGAGCLLLHDEQGEVEKMYFSLVDPGRDIDMGDPTVGLCG